jgi:hypothetical protein
MAPFLLRRAGHMVQTTGNDGNHLGRWSVLTLAAIGIIAGCRGDGGIEPVRETTASIATVQTKSGGTFATTATFDQPQAAGDLNVVIIGWGDNTSTVTSISDTQGNTYSLAAPMVTIVGSPPLRQAIYFAKNIAAGSNTVRANFNGSPYYPDLRILEYSGIDKASPFDVTASATGSGTGGATVSSGSATTTAAKEVIVGAGMTTWAYAGPGSSFAQRVITSDGNIAEDRTVSTAGSYGASAVLGGPGQTWLMQMVTFKASTTSPPAPTLASVTPSRGPAAGGTTTTLSGTNFVSGATVSFCGTAAASVTFQSATQLTAATPAHAAGACDVQVRNPDSQSATLAGGFTFTMATPPPPTLTSVAPSSGSTAGGTAITLSGANFVSGATVRVCGTAATSVSFVSATQLTAQTAAHAAGACDVTVQNPDAQSATLTGAFTFVPASAPLRWVQTKSGGTFATSAAFNQPEAQGDLNVVVIGWGDDTSSVSAVSDTRGNAYSIAAPMITMPGNPPLRQLIYYAKNIASGADTVSVAFNGTPYYPDLRILEYSGADPAAPFDVTASGSGSSNGGTSVSTGSVTTTSPNEVLVAGGMTTSTYAGSGSSFTSRIITSDGNLAEDDFVSAAGSYSASATLSGGAQTWLLQLVTFKASGGGTCVPTTCAAQGKNCGAIPDGCGGMLTCGSCTAPATCGGGGTANVCGTGACTPTTCAAQHAECGSIPDGCGHTLTCPVTCGSPATCGGGGSANVCGYTTHFNEGAEATTVEKPISQGGVWLNGQANGTSWSDVWAGLGRAYGAPTNTKFSCGGDPGRYADPTAILRGGWQPDGQGHSFWNPNQTVTATASCESNVTSVPYPEVEIRLRFQVTNGVAQGYEIMWRCSNAGNIGNSYVAVARWNGALCDYTGIGFTSGPASIDGGQGVVDGDTVTAQIVGSTLTLYKNGQLQGTLSDPSPPNASFGFGNPGIGFNYLAADNGSATSGLNDQFGFTSFVATDLP